MTKTTTERLDEINVKLELLVTQQRVIIQQNEQIEEFMHYLAQAFATEAEATEISSSTGGIDPTSAQNIADIVKALSGEDEEPKDPQRPGWGYDAHLARQRNQESPDDD